MFRVSTTFHTRLGHTPSNVWTRIPAAMALARSFIVKPWPSEIITNIARLYVSHLPFATDRNGSLYLEPYPVDRKQLANQLAFKSHALYSACLPVLWEYIVISSSEALQRTALLLETGTSQETRVMGAYVRRVDFCIDQEYDPEEVGPWFGH